MTAPLKSLVDVALYLHGADLDPHAISELLGVAGDVMRGRGDSRILKSGNQVTAKAGVWRLGSGVTSSVLSEHVEALREKIRFAGSLANIEGVESAELDIYVELGGTDGSWKHEGRLSSHHLAWIAQAGVALSMTSSHVED